ncbi:MAG: DUF92 domain-containing protein, partial [Methermicoccaceae archaeon]
VVLLEITSEVEIIFLSFLGGIACAMGDTLASEIGQTSHKIPRMITTMRRVRVGTDGGVTALGELASLFGSALVGGLAILMMYMGGFIGVDITFLQVMITAIVCGFAGTNIDSLLGAVLQTRGVLTNGGVNVVATSISAGIGAVIAYVWC